MRETLKIKRWFALDAFAYGLLDSSRNALKDHPVAYRYTVSILLATMWCVAFGIYTTELMTIGYNIVGHFALITSAFVTWGVFNFATTSKFGLFAIPIILVAVKVAMCVMIAQVIL